MLYLSVAVVQVSLDSGTNHALQLLGSPACVGAGGVGLSAEEAGEVDEADVVVLVGVTDTLADEEDEAVPTQYASSAQKPVEQSDETAGFHAKNWATVIPYSVATVVHVSSACATYQLLQSAGSPDWVGPGGDATVVVAVALPSSGTVSLARSG